MDGTNQTRTPQTDYTTKQKELLQTTLHAMEKNHRVVMEKFKGEAVKQMTSSDLFLFKVYFLSRAGVAILSTGF